MAIRNAGPAAAATPRGTDVLPAGLGFVSATTATSGVTRAAAGQTVTCDLPTMAVDDSITITLTVSVASSRRPRRHQHGVGALRDPRPGHHEQHRQRSDRVPSPTCSSRSGWTVPVRNATVTYVLDATNLGPSPSSSAVAITDTLPEGSPSWMPRCRGQLHR
ncbi:MAG: hypothetical protein R2713_13005 [Ilumatobacteraceae bacterium]